MIININEPHTIDVLAPTQRHAFRTYGWLLQTLINNVLHPPFHKMQWLSRVIGKQQRAFWFQRKTETNRAIVDQMIKKKILLLEPAHTAYDRVGFSLATSLPLHTTSLKPRLPHWLQAESISLLLHMLFFPQKSNRGFLLVVRREDLRTMRHIMKHSSFFSLLSHNGVTYSGLVLF